MKKLTFLFFAMMFAMFSMAQNSALNAAKSAFENGDYKTAYENINSAAEHKKTIDNPETWVYKAMIYSAVSSTGLTEMLGIQITEEETLAALEKADSLDPDGSYDAQLAEAADFIINQTHNAGVKAYSEEKDYQKAVDLFQKKQSLTEQFKPDAPADTIGVVVIGSSYVNLEQVDNAIPYYEQAVELDYDDQGIYNTLIRYYDENENQEKYLDILKKAQVKYPEENNYLLLELDHYIKNGQAKEKLEDLKAAAEKNPDNVNLPILIAGIYEREENYEMQQEWAQKAVAIQPESFAANFNLGVAIFNQAVAQNYIMNSETTTDSQVYVSAKAKRDELAAKAFPHFEKAYNMKPEDRAVIQAMAQYYRLTGDDAKRDEFEAKLAAE